MERKLIIAEMQYGTVSALTEDGQIVTLQAEREEESILGNIYLARVKYIAKNIDAAFVEAAPGLICYLPLEDCKNAVFTNSKKDGAPHENDELIVQVTKERVKTKDPVVTAKIAVTGKFTVLTAGNRRIGLSGKLSPEERQTLRDAVMPWYLDHPEFGVIVRTNAREAQTDQIYRELSASVSLYKGLVEKAVHRTAPRLLKKAPRPCLSLIRDTYTDGLSQIVTDSEEIYEEALAYLRAVQPEDCPKLSLYRDEGLALYKLHRMETVIHNALSKKVWLKSGGYLVIEPTEALTVIDVNTGKFTEKKQLQETFLKINLEAAREIAFQLRLRNLSGIIVVDFIDMERDEYDRQLLDELRERLSRDPVKTTLIDMTALHLAEIVRKKSRMSLAEQLRVRP